MDLLEKNKLSLLKEKIWTGCRVYWCLWILCCCGYSLLSALLQCPGIAVVAYGLIYTLVLKPSSYFGKGSPRWRLCFSSEWEGKKNSRFAIFLWVSFIIRSWWHFQEIGKVKLESNLSFPLCTDTGFKLLSDSELRFWKYFSGNNFFKDHFTTWNHNLQEKSFTRSNEHFFLFQWELSRTQDKMQRLFDIVFCFL